jgi:hypothetical protein
MVNVQATVPMSKSFYDRSGIERNHGVEFLTPYFGLVINTDENCVMMREDFRERTHMPVVMLGRRILVQYHTWQS